MTMRACSNVTSLFSRAACPTPLKRMLAPRGLSPSEAIARSSSLLVTSCLLAMMLQPAPAYQAPLTGSFSPRELEIVLRYHNDSYGGSFDENSDAQLQVQALASFNKSCAPTPYLSSQQTHQLLSSACRRYATSEEIFKFGLGLAKEIKESRRYTETNMSFFERMEWELERRAQPHAAPPPPLPPPPLLPDKRPPYNCGYTRCFWRNDVIPKMQTALHACSSFTTEPSSNGVPRIAWQVLWDTRAFCLHTIVCILAIVLLSLEDVACCTLLILSRNGRRNTIGVVNCITVYLCFVTYLSAVQVVHRSNAPLTSFSRDLAEGCQGFEDEVMASFSLPNAPFPATLFMAQTLVYVAISGMVVARAEWTRRWVVLRLTQGFRVSEQGLLSGSRGALLRV